MICVLLVIVLMPTGVSAQQRPASTAIINGDQGKLTISRHIYGHFAEHLESCIYGGIWVGEYYADVLRQFQSYLYNFPGNRLFKIGCGATYSKITGSILTAAAMNSCNTFDRPDTVKPSEFAVAKSTESGIEIQLPSKCVVMLELI